MDRVHVVREAIKAGLYPSKVVVDRTVDILAARLVAGGRQFPGAPIREREASATEWFSMGFVAGWDGQDWPEGKAWPNRGAELAWQDGYAAGREDRLAMPKR